MSNRTKSKQRKIYLTEEKSLELDKYLKANGIKLQEFLETHIDAALKGDN